MNSPRPEQGRQPPSGGLDYEAFRAVMGSFASGVAVVTTRANDGEPHGLTCSAVCSVSVDPPLLLTCIRTPSRTLDALRESGTFVVNFLDARARDLSQHFSSRDTSKFGSIPTHPGPATEVPVLDRVLAYAECSTRQLIEAGDHVVVIGLLIGGDVDLSRFPLGYWRGSYMQMYRLDQPSSRTAEAHWDEAASAEPGYDLEPIGL